MILKKLLLLYVLMKTKYLLRNSMKNLLIMRVFLRERQKNLKNQLLQPTMQTNLVKMVENETIKISKAMKIIQTKAIGTNQDIHRPIATKTIKILNLTRAFVNYVINKVTLLKDARTSTMLLLLGCLLYHLSHTIPNLLSLHVLISQHNWVLPPIGLWTLGLFTTLLSV